MVDIKSISKKQSKLNNLKWTMATWCNYKCPYCIQEDKKRIN